jgi:hypothetical protein
MESLDWIPLAECIEAISCSSERGNKTSGSIKLGKRID